MGKPDPHIGRDPWYHRSRYTIYRLPYEPAAIGEGALRPTIQIELRSRRTPWHTAFRRSVVTGTSTPSKLLAMPVHVLTRGGGWWSQRSPLATMIIGHGDVAGNVP